MAEAHGKTTARSAAPSRDEIAAYHLIDENRVVGGLLERAQSSEEASRSGSCPRPWCN